MGSGTRENSLMGIHSFLQGGGLMGRNGVIREHISLVMMWGLDTALLYRVPE